MCQAHRSHSITKSCLLSNCPYHMCQFPYYIINSWRLCVQFIFLFALVLSHFLVRRSPELYLMNERIKRHWKIHLSSRLLVYNSENLSLEEYSILYNSFLLNNFNINLQPWVNFQRDYFVGNSDLNLIMYLMLGQANPSASVEFKYAISSYFIPWIWNTATFILGLIQVPVLGFIVCVLRGHRELSVKKLCNYNIPKGRTDDVL